MPDRPGSRERARSGANTKWYVVRHWRGDLGLAASSWLSGLVVSLVIPAIGLLVIAVLDDYDRGRELALFLGLRGVLIAAQVWLAVGIWRAASRHGARGGHRRWAFLAKLAVAVGAFCAFTEFAVAGIPEMTQLYDLSEGHAEMAVAATAP